MSLLPEEISRIESKIDKLAEAVTKLVLVEERQLTQGVRLGSIETRMALAEEATRVGVAAAAAATLVVNAKVDRWINYGVGAWSVAVLVFALASKFIH
jgi:hypothetical protein